MSAASNDTQQQTSTLLIGLSVVMTALIAAGCAADEPNQAGDGNPSTVASQPFSTPPTVSWPFGTPTVPTSQVPPTALPEGITVDRRNPDSVALGAARIWYGWDTTRDQSPYAAALRTAPLMVPECRSRLAGQPPTGSPGDYWTQLALVHAKARLTADDVRLGAEDRPADSPGRAVRIVTVTQRFEADRPTPPRRYVVMMSLTSRSGTWYLGNPETGDCGVRPR
ncbi:hypothetical protein [Gordonia polyisoprenivorans]|uniref:hypothetical protein n=1 Tax=Gordonia polyisoprenivorans TaxID=84595 RepID=UPI00036E4F97|nr:hypothetical protein [Gordonia polyisoprenivorans]